MQFEVIRKSHKKSILVGVTIFIILAIVLIVRFTFAKYELVKSIKIAEGTINYKVPDFKIMAMYKSDGNGYVEIETMPESGYAINESKSYCTLDNVNKDTKAKLFTNEDGKHIISGLSKSSKCYIYFDKKLSSGETILANVTVNEGTPDFSKTAQATCSSTSTCETTNGVYKAEDNDGTSYYFRGSVENNYVKFANKWWRIIRINGDGSIRLIYDGTSAHANGTSTTNNMAVATTTFNSSIGNNAYAGFQYTIGQVHGHEIKSDALEQLEVWYTNNLENYSDKIDNNAGFCGDRTPSLDPSTSTGSGGTGTTTTYYGPGIRLLANKKPELICANVSDLYTLTSSTKGSKSLTYPIGLISADEVAMAGGVNGISNQYFYLYNGQYYWTLSPYHFSMGTNSAYILGVNLFGNLDSVVSNIGSSFGLRPVINLRSNTKFTFTGTGEKGTMSNPYIVS